VPRVRLLPGLPTGRAPLCPGRLLPCDDRSNRRVVDDMRGRAPSVDLAALDQSTHLLDVMTMTKISSSTRRLMVSLAVLCSVVVVATAARPGLLMSVCRVFSFAVSPASLAASDRGTAALTD